jgi:hypothetical protein
MTFTSSIAPNPAEMKTKATQPAHIGTTRTASTSIAGMWWRRERRMVTVNAMTARQAAAAASSPPVSASGRIDDRPDQTGDAMIRLSAPN